VFWSHSAVVENRSKVLVAIPAYNEEATIAQVVDRVRTCAPGFDLLVVNDGSVDATESILSAAGVWTATHLCNLGYGRAIQTALEFALRHRYETLITLDADGQHLPEQVLQMYEAYEREGWDYLLGSRYVATGDYSAAALGRRIGMRLFSRVTEAVTGRRIYDTTSGLKILRRTVFEPLDRWHFVDFHAEAIVYLSRLGFSVGEHPITAAERRHGTSMYSLASSIVYPLKTGLMVALAAIHARLSRAAARR
jgi:glycosyltransferase involved in cell wall biosynthesis